MSLTIVSALAARLRVAVLVGEADDGVRCCRRRRICGFGPDRVEGDPERSVQAFGEDLVDLGLAVAVGVAEDADAVGAALGDEQVAVRRRANDPRLLQPVGELQTLKPAGTCGIAPSG